MSKIEKILGPNLLKDMKYETFAGTASYTISTKVTRFKYPNSLTDSLKISNKFIVFQIYKRIGENVCIVLNMKNDNDDTLKVQFAGQTKSVRTSQSITSDIIDVPDNTWTNVCFDLEYIMSKYFDNNVFKSLVSFEIIPTCHIRNVFSIPFQLLPENNGNDLPDAVKYNGLSSVTILVGERREQTSQKERTSRIPIRRKIPATPQYNRAQHTVEDTKPAAFTKKIEDDSEEEEETESSDAFGSSPSKQLFQTPNTPDIDDSEEEMELIYLEALGCYYCPSNQQYYQVDESKV
ncbi:hypothetical protein TVAG_066470 [Trichomonas vaginalis G3]|uniref:CFA20 domain-containing protein n=1 Tax=Trichomonas vaginalis (strain ATCC PRA-98 / G3) TaxID=412133 RepID=A2FFI0_TRIV3|nr:Cilia- and flagella-associated protein 20/CFAP20DC family [Trichomonas vaginalis G3]EAX96350.1 hypothetical protein TVAG_066470 [Trichomonas vaginalis G3]KAI5520136.1 Cilia- and flagella-associated protein 20/CFAP20DC family [Trichomonas vaginalis G3]|eukprot:XP_001309280.1 hypothetical protein [Trichomonas vaginalis G3]